MKELGVRAAFDAQVADFTPLTDVPAFLSNVRQAARVKVDEEGVEAAAFTEMSVCTSSLPMGVVEMKLDRPFIFAIYDQHDLPLFVGSGLFSVQGMTLCLFLSQQECSLAVSGILLYLAPSFVVLMSALLSALPGGGRLGLGGDALGLHHRAQQGISRLYAFFLSRQISVCPLFDKRRALCYAFFNRMEGIA